MTRPVVAAAFAALAVLDLVAITLDRIAARRAPAESDSLPYAGFDASGTIPPFDDTEALLLSWVPDGLPDDLVDWFLGADGGAL